MRPDCPQNPVIHNGATNNAQRRLPQVDFKSGKHQDKNDESSREIAIPQAKDDLPPQRYARLLIDDLSNIRCGIAREIEDCSKGKEDRKHLSPSIGVLARILVDRSLITAMNCLRCKENKPDFLSLI